MDNIYKTPEAPLTSTLDQEFVDYELYKVSGIGVATFFGTPIAGGILMSKNFKKLGNGAAAKKAIIYSIIATIVIIGIAAVIPENLHIPNSAFNVPQLVAMIYLAKYFQEKDIASHMDKGGKVASNWKAFGVGLLVLLALIAIAAPFIAYFVINAG